MASVISGNTLIPPGVSPYLVKFREILVDMDRQYGRVAGRYGFVCSGCDDNCCRTRFHHHTFLEYFYFLEGVATLDPLRSETVIRRAADVCRRTDEALHIGEPLRLMCPVNENQRCMVYAHRPMICRLHGIPHEFQPPGRPRVQGSGCDAFTRQCWNREYIRFDRTGFYFAVAELEKGLRDHLGVSQKPKFTIAEMILRARK